MTSKSTRRLFVAVPLRPDTELLLTAEQARYLGRVLRLRAGDGITLFDGSGSEYDAVMTGVSRQGITVRVGIRNEPLVESPLAVHLIQAIGRGERMDFVVQKATELGVRRISPVVTEFSVVRLDAAKAAQRVAHWTRVAQSACEQCGRTVPPIVDMPQPLQSLLAGTATQAQRWVLRPGASRSLASLASAAETPELLVGPEGGLSAAEYGDCRTAGFVECSLGPRILRTETAAMAALAVLQSLRGDLG